MKYKKIKILTDLHKLLNWVTLIDISMYHHGELAILFDDNSYVIFKVNDDKISKPDFYLDSSILTDKQILDELLYQKLINKEEYEDELLGLNKIKTENESIELMYTIANKYGFEVIKNEI